MSIFSCNLRQKNPLDSWKMCFFLPFRGINNFNSFHYAATSDYVSQFSEMLSQTDFVANAIDLTPRLHSCILQRSAATYWQLFRAVA